MITIALGVLLGGLLLGTIRYWLPVVLVLAVVAFMLGLLENPNLLEPLTAEDQITADVVVKDDDVWLENIVVAHSPDATLVCPINQAHRLKELLELIRQHGGEEFL